MGIRAKNAEKNEYAYLLFMQNKKEKEICQSVGITQPTLRKWKAEGNWEEKRASQAMSIDTILSKSLLKINEMLDKPGFKADEFSKAISQLKHLKSGENIKVDDVIRIFLKFSDFLQTEALKDDTVDETVMKIITQYQDRYIHHLINKENDF
ncbi:phage terminase small subunit-related protein [Flammeovirga sp. OC4]|uniref:phage terminase small subunit-related protein n=1 Tax=Flammeovirga sp. OC4 TaxID=1382345 RepID=UPI00155DDAF4|nr:phage terminase small subunit-related protein [Flammeovirga sp. OC4]